MEESEKQKRRIKFSEKERFSDGISVVVVEFPMTDAMVRMQSPRQKRRTWKRGNKFLQRLGADIVVPTLTCSKVLDIPVMGKMTVESELVPEDMPEALGVALGTYTASPKGKTGCVVDRECSSVCKPLLIAMSQKVEFVCLVTVEREKAENVEEFLCEEYGVILDIYGRLPHRECTMLADVNQGKILVHGKTFIDGRIKSLDLHGYHVDLGGLLKGCPELEEKLFPVEWRKGKSG